MRRIQLTPTLIEQIALDVRAGNFMEPSARRHGVGHSTLHKWLACGRERLAEVDAAEDRSERRGGRRPETAGDTGPAARWSERDRLCVDLVDALEKAEAEVRVVAIVQNAIPTNWAAGFRWLESRDRSRWLRVERQELTGKDGGALQVEDPTAKLIAETDRVAKRLFETYGAPPWMEADRGSENV